MTSPQSKTCALCREIKPLECFYRQSKSSDGRQSYCKACSAIKTKEREPTRREARAKKYAEDPEPGRAACRSYHAANRERVTARMRARYQANKEAAKAYNREYYATKRERVAAQGAVAYALRAGKLVREPCLFCDAPKVEAHHHSYERADWLSVTWLCRVHHALAHRFRDIDPRTT